MGEAISTATFGTENIPGGYPPGPSGVQRMVVARRELASLIGRALPADGSRQLQPGLFIHRRSRAGGPVHSFADPALCVIVQGSKLVLVGDRRLQYDDEHYLITTANLPLTGQILDASEAKPYLALRLLLTPAMVTSVVLDTGLRLATVPTTSRIASAADTSRLDADLIDALLRLVRLAGEPSRYPALAPLVVREIVYRLLTGRESVRMLHLARVGGRASQIDRAIQFIRRNYARRFTVTELAGEVHMGNSSFYAHFRAVTGLSPLQFQKQLRLQAARQLLIDGTCDATTAAYRVGYQDASQFNREYKRRFGRPPIRDVSYAREMTQELRQIDW